MAAVMMAEDEMKAIADGSIDAALTSGILEGTTVFYCINTTSHAAWGTLPALMRSLFELEVEVIDHRSWHTKFESTVINEVYVKGILKKDMALETQMEGIQLKIKDAISQDVSKKKSALYFVRYCSLVTSQLNACTPTLFSFQRMP